MVRYHSKEHLHLVGIIAIMLKSYGNFSQIKIVNLSHYVDFFEKYFLNLMEEAQWGSQSITTKKLGGNCL